MCQYARVPEAQRMRIGSYSHGYAHCVKLSVVFYACWAQDFISLVQSSLIPRPPPSFCRLHYKMRGEPWNKAKSSPPFHSTCPVHRSIPLNSDDQYLLWYNYVYTLQTLFAMNLITMCAHCYVSLVIMHASYTRSSL